MTRKVNINYSYHEAIDSLMYLIQLTRPDIMFAVNLLSRYSTCFIEVHRRAVKRIFKYLAGTTKLGIKLYVRFDFGCVCRCWLCWRRRNETIDDGIYFYSLRGDLFRWCSRRQRSVSMSTTKAEYVQLLENLYDCDKF